MSDNETGTPTAAPAESLARSIAVACGRDEADASDYRVVATAALRKVEALQARCAELEREAVIQKGVIEIAYRPHRLLVEQNDSLHFRLSAAEQRAAKAESLLKHLREEWLEADDYAPEYRDKFNAVLVRIDAALEPRT